jgi:curved DNA-binding protein CbpA
MNDYYKILEIEPNASQEQIKSQYRFLVQAWHPDKFGSPEAKAKAEEKLKLINAAYTALKNSAKEAREEKDRAEADRRRQEQAEAQKREDERKQAEAARRENEQREAREKAERERAKQEAEEQATRAKAEKEAQEKKKMFCTFCGTNIPYEKFYCPKCGKPFMSKSCPHCKGKNLPQKALFCPYCGKKV